MKISSLQIGVISLLLAVSLWLVATLLEDDSRWLPAKADTPENLSVSSNRKDTPVKADTDVLSCELSETLLKSEVENAQSCSTDDDCTLFDFGYPIQCMTSVRKSEISALRLAYREYEQSCAYRVYYDCPSGEMQRMAVCRNNQCAVELQTTDPLKDETLQHLGIKEL